MAFPESVQDVSKLRIAEEATNDIREFPEAAECAGIRYIIEQVIANFKTWRIMHTDYRRPPATFPETISAVAALQFYATT